MDHLTDTAMGEVCSACGYTDGHDVRTCPLVLDGRVKVMPGLSPEAVARLRGAGFTVAGMDHPAAD